MEMVRLDPPAELTMPIGEAMFSQRATRRLDPDRPITDAQLKIILDAASKAPNGGNAQPARFLVIRDREAIKKFGKLYHEAWWAKRRDAYGWKGKEDIPEGSQYRWAALLADEMENAPCVILAYSAASGVAAASTFPGVTKPAALGACARYRQRTDDLASGGHGTGARNVRYSGRRCVPLLYPVGLPARQFRSDEPPAHQRDDVLGQMG